MGAVGGLLGLGGGASGTGYTVNAPVNQAQINQSVGQNQALISALQNQGGLQNQSQVYNQLQQVASGQGPNPAQAMLNQATGQNVSNQAALMAGQRGAASNVGLMARQAAQQGAQTQQQAAGQGATMQANQSLNALNQAGSMANTMAGQQIGATQGQESTLLNAMGQSNQTQAGLAQTEMAGQNQMIGGLLGGLGGASAVAAAYGGQINGYALGGQAGAGPSSGFGKFMAGMNNSMNSSQKTPPLQQGMTQFTQGIKNGLGSLFGGSAGTIGAANTPVDAGSTMMAAHGGEIPVMLSPGERKLNPKEAKMVAKGKASPMEVGGQVPGKAKVKGDDYSNDIVKDKVPAGSVIIPRSVMQSKNPERGAADFVRSVLAKKGLK